MTQPSHNFGGDWTQEKLERVRKYLQAYTRIMSKRSYLQFAYVDAFAGTGYRTLKHDEEENELLFPDLAGEEPQSFLEGSARIALQVKPRFHKYIFVEKHLGRFAQLAQLRDEFPALAKDIILVNADANTYLQDELCAPQKNWKKHRAVLFLDPYGMQVEWQTLEAIASTKAIDLWMLFPIGAVNRLLGVTGKSIRQYNHV